MLSRFFTNNLKSVACICISALFTLITIITIQCNHLLSEVTNSDCNLIWIRHWYEGLRGTLENKQHPEEQQIWRYIIIKIAAIATYLCQQICSPVIFKVKLKSKHFYLGWPNQVTINTRTIFHQTICFRHLYLKYLYWEESGPEVKFLICVKTSTQIRNCVDTQIGE